jgi:cobalt-zinc-cadmium efflux system membrane fusion protein
MSRKFRIEIMLCAALCILLAGCGAKAASDPSAGMPPPATVEKELDSSMVKVDHPEQFPLATATPYQAAADLSVTGVVTPDVSRTVPVISLASGRVVDIRARLGDEVKKGQLLVRIRSADITSAFSDYRKGVANEALTKAQLERAKALLERGAIAQKDVEVAQTADETARVDVQNAEERIKVLGSDPQHPDGVVDITAPISGVITEQNVTASAGVKTLDNSPNLFTIADLSSVWIVCDVYENDLASVKVGEYADLRLNAYPDKTFKGRISNIAPILDPSIRTAKVRLEVQNSGLMRIGMFVTATFRGQKKETHALVPATAILHLHDREWAYLPDGGRFRRVEVTGGNILPGNMQEILSGIDPGQQVVSNALVLQNTVEQ